MKNTFEALVIVWDMLLMKAFKSMGEPTVNALETGANAGFFIFKTMRSGGIMGLWEFAKEKFSDLKEIIIDAIKDVCASGANVDHQSDRRGIKWLLSLLIPALIEAILALAAGSVVGVAKAIEFLGYYYFHWSYPHPKNLLI